MNTRKLWKAGRTAGILVGAGALTLTGCATGLESAKKHRWSLPYGRTTTAISLIPSIN